MGTPSVVDYTTTGIAGPASSYTRSLASIDAGDLVVLHHLDNMPQTAQTVSDNLGYSWSLVKRGAAGTTDGEVWVGVPPATRPTGAMTVTVTLTAATYTGGELYQLRTAAASVTATQVTGSGTTPASGTYTATETGELVMEFVTATVPITANPAAPWTTSDNPKFPGSTHQYGGAAWQTATSGTAYAASWTCGSAGWSVVTLAVMAPVVDVPATGSGSMAFSGAGRAGDAVTAAGVGALVFSGSARASASGRLAPDIVLTAGSRTWTVEAPPRAWRAEGPARTWTVEAAHP